MLNIFYELGRGGLFALPPEKAHEVTLRALEWGVFPERDNASEEALATKLWGLTFPNPIGVAAGFDKDARVAQALIKLGCGFSEIGTVTPKPQPGNPRPRIFRLVQDQAVINRLGFNNGGHEMALERLLARYKSGARGIVGVNIGANKDSEDRAGDYAKGIETFADVADYFTVNISSPNTPGLRDLQAPDELDKLLSRVMAAREGLEVRSARQTPIVVKIAPDIAEEELPKVVDQLVAHDVSGIAVSNTTLSRKGLTDALASESGGLSGRPLFHRSTVMLARVYELTDGKIPLIGIGGIDSGGAALAKFEAGASLIQLYTGLIYEGPGLIGRISSHLARALRAEGSKNIADLRGRKAAEWARKPLTADELPPSAIA